MSGCSQTLSTEMRGQLRDWKSGLGLEGIKVSPHIIVCLSVLSLLLLPLLTGVCISSSCLCTCNLDLLWILSSICSKL